MPKSINEVNMPDTVCSNCVHYAPIKIPTGNRGSKNTRQGHCLAQSVYAVNKPGKNVYPIGAKTAVLPYARHSIVVVREDQIVLHCTTRTQKGSTK